MGGNRSARCSPLCVDLDEYINVGGLWADEYYALRVILYARASH